MNSHAPTLAGLPQAKAWITHFAAQLPAQHKPIKLRAVFTTAGWRAKTWLKGRAFRTSTAAAVGHSFDWVAMLSVSIVDTHHRRAQAIETNRDAIDGEIDWCVRTIDAKIAGLLDVPARRIEVGRLVSAMAERWVAYTQYPQDDAAMAGVLAAQRAYSTRVEQLSTHSLGGTS
ncbi:hypothetical protein [Nocardia gipuzkoensis]|uniref:hypothetical protein n=1 Tax=Nocardia gipuzkoensis TaxID=2749991 RepID=UPI00237E25DA|nr:hypothetical protein [Nocardia gipuzkoensis]MDE1675201.1 hypothetical protein [Nocardia gipuzkoensis]